MPPGDWLAAVAFPTMFLSIILPWIIKTGSVSTAVPVYGYDTDAVFLAPIAIAGYVALWGIPERSTRGQTFVLLGGAAAILAFSLAFEPDTAQSCGFFRCERGTGGFVAFLSGLGAALAGTMVKSERKKKAGSGEAAQSGES
jgi:hypothetical protein